MLRNADGVGVSHFPEKNVTKVYGSTLLALRGDGVQFPGKKCYVTLEWPLSLIFVAVGSHGPIV